MIPRLPRLSRDDWDARPARRRTVTPWRRVRGIEVHHSVTPSSQPLAAAMRSIQRYHMDGRRWSDIFYNEAVAITGQRAAGRRWGPEGVSLSQSSVPYLTVVLIGNYEDRDRPSDEQWRSLAEIRAEVANWGGGTALTWHHQRSSSACPGRHAIRRLESDPPPIGIPEEEDDMTPEQAAKLDAIHDALLVDGVMHRHGWAIQNVNATASRIESMLERFDVERLVARIEDTLTIELEDADAEAIATAVRDEFAEALSRGD